MGFLGPIIARLLASRIGAAMATKAPQILEGAKGLLGVGTKAPPVQADGIVPPGRVHPSSPRAPQQNILASMSGKIPQAEKPSFKGLENIPGVMQRVWAKQGIKSAPAGSVTSVPGGDQQQEGPDTVDEGKKFGGSVARAGKTAAIAGPAGLILAFAGITLAGKKLADALVEGQRGLAKFNGQIGFAYARLNRGELLRQRASGQRTAGSADALISAVNEMRNEFQPLKDLGTNILNTVGTAFAKVVGHLAKVVKVVTDLLNWFSAQKAPQLGPWQQALNQQAQNYRDINRPRGGRANP